MALLGAGGSAGNLRQLAPSRVPEKINWLKKRNTHSFRMLDGDFVFQAHGDGGYFENLYVLSNELTKALEEIKALDPEALADPS